MVKQLTIELIWTIEDSVKTGVSMDEAEKIIDSQDMMSVLNLFAHATMIKDSVDSPAKQVQDLLAEIKSKLPSDNEVIETLLENNAYSSDKAKIPICFDFDGVIHSFKSGWIDFDIIPDEPVQYIRQLLLDMKSSGRFIILVHSSRCGYEGGVEAIELFMKEFSLPYDKVCKHKPNARMYVDDYGYQFKSVTDFRNKLRDLKWMK